MSGCSCAKRRKKEEGGKNCIAGNDQSGNSSNEHHHYSYNRHRLCLEDRFQDTSCGMSSSLPVPVGAGQARILLDQRKRKRRRRDGTSSAAPSPMTPESLSARKTLQQRDRKRRKHKRRKRCRGSLAAGSGDNDADDDDEEDDLPRLRLVERGGEYAAAAAERSDGAVAAVNEPPPRAAGPQRSTAAGTAAAEENARRNPSSCSSSEASVLASAAEAGTTIASFPFETDPDDHCESPIEAYQDIAHLLRKALQLQRHEDHQRQQRNSTSTNDDGCMGSDTIYDPYYCNGAVIENLKSLGFERVYNRNEDCYAVWSSCSSPSSPSSSSLPAFGALVSNPPYSKNHVERLLEFVASPVLGTRPWFLLLPNWVVKKDYYDRIVLRALSGTRTTEPRSQCAPFYLVPRKRYVYLPPARFRAPKASDTHKKSSPFVSMWYVWGGTIERTEALVREHYRQQHSHPSNEPLPSCDLARSKSALRDLRRKRR